MSSISRRTLIVLTCSLPYFCLLSFSIFCFSVLSGVLPAAEPRQWPVELKVGRFEIHCDFPLNSSEVLLRELESVSRDMERLLEVRSNSQPVHIVLFKTDTEYRRYMQTYFPGIPARRAIFIQDRGPGMLFTHWHEDVATDLRHEVAHALLNHGGNALPLWLDEGLAEYFEVPEGQRFAGNPYRLSIANLSDSEAVAPVHELEKAKDIANFTDKNYRDSWAWVHFLIHRRRETRQLLVRYLQVHASGASPFELSRAMAELSSQLDVELSDHFCQLPDFQRAGRP